MWWIEQSEKVETFLSYDFFDSGPMKSLKISTFSKTDAFNSTKTTKTNFNQNLENQLLSALWHFSVTFVTKVLTKS